MVSHSEMFVNVYFSGARFADQSGADRRNGGSRQRYRLRSRRQGGKGDEARRDGARSCIR